MSAIKVSVIVLIEEPATTVEAALRNLHRRMAMAAKTMTLPTRYTMGQDREDLDAS